MNYFEELDNDILVGYHIEGGETFDNTGLPALSMDTLTDSRALYLCDNPKEWFASHLVGKIYQRVLKVKFHKTNSQLYQWDDYMNIAPMARDDESESRDLSGNELYMLTGVYLHYTLGFPRGELTEAFLIHPTKHVISIEEVFSC